MVQVGSTMDAGIHNDYGQGANGYKVGGVGTAIPH